MNLFRWNWLPNAGHEIWGIENLPGMIDDFLSAMETERY